VKDELKKGRILAFRLLKYRDRSEKEIIERLKKKKISSQIIKRILEELKSLSLLDDKKFSQSWIRKRLREGYGFLRIKKELKEKGIREDLVKELINNFKKEKNIPSQIEELIKKRARRYKDESIFNTKRKLLSYLVRRGFSYEEVIQALKNWEDAY